MIQQGCHRDGVTLLESPQGLYEGAGLGAEHEGQGSVFAFALGQAEKIAPQLCVRVRACVCACVCEWERGAEKGKMGRVSRQQHSKGR